VSWVTACAPPAPDRRFALPARPRPDSPLALAYHRTRKHPLATLGAAVGTVATVIGVSTGVSAAATSTPIAASTPAVQTATAAWSAPDSSPLAAAASQPLTPLTGSADQSVSPLGGAAGQGISLGAPAAAPAAPAQLQHQAAPARQPAPARLAASAQPKVASHPVPAIQHTAAAAHPRVVASAPPARSARSGHDAGARHRAWRHRDWRHRTWRRQSQARRAWPYLIYDSVTPTAIPAHHVVATYATGPFAVSAAQVAGRKAVLWIDTRGTDPQAAALDVEPGDATPTAAAGWAWQRLHTVPYSTAIIYTMRSEWPATQAAIATLPHWMQNHVRWWIADPTGYPHIVPGSSATQWYWGTHYDITTANPGF
jgi:hypothetical protein